MSITIDQIQKDLYEGNAEAVKAGVEKALAEGMPAQDILDQGLLAGMDVVGRDFKSGDLPILIATDVASRGRDAGGEGGHRRFPLIRSRLRRWWASDTALSRKRRMP